MTDNPQNLVQWKETPAAVRNRRGRGLVFRIAAITMVMVLLAVIVVSRACSGYHVGFDLLANFSYFLVIPLLGLFLAAVSTRESSVAGFAFVAAVVGATPLLSPAAQRIADSSDGLTASVLHCNLRGSLAAWNGVRAIMAARKPDIVAVVEVSDRIIERIVSDKELLGDYPHRVLPRPGLEWPQVVFSRHPMQAVPSAKIKPGTRMQSLFSSHRSNLIALPIGKIIFSTEHVPSPRNSAAWNMGNEQIVALGHVIRDHYRKFKLPILVTGDFNSSPAGYRDSLMRKETALLPNPESFPPSGTWPSALPRFFRLPIDRAWASEEVALDPPDVLPDVGSDHRPIYFHFAIPGIVLEKKSESFP